MILIIEIAPRSPHEYNWEIIPPTSFRNTRPVGILCQSRAERRLLPCPVGWKIAKDMAIPKIAIGAVMDKLGVRIANCQLGFFRVEKTPPYNEPHESSQEIVTGLRDLNTAGNLTCAAAFELARRLRQHL